MLCLVYSYYQRRDVHYKTRLRIILQCPNELSLNWMGIINGVCLLSEHSFLIFSCLKSLCVHQQNNMHGIYSRIMALLCAMLRAGLKSLCFSARLCVCVCVPMYERGYNTQTHIETRFLKYMKVGLGRRFCV